MAVESQRIIGHSNFLFFVLSLSPNQMRDRLPLIVVNKNYWALKVFSPFALPSFLRHIPVCFIVFVATTNSLVRVN